MLHSSSDTTIDHDVVPLQLSGRRLRLRPLTPNDLPALYLIVTDETIAWR